MRLYKRVLMIALTLLLLRIPIYAAPPMQWPEVKGTYAKADNSQYNSGTLSLLYLENDVVIFEFFMMAGSEQTHTSNSFCLAGAFYIDDNGVGLYEHPKTGDVKITFDLSDGVVTVKQTGKLPIEVSGNYKFVENHIKVTQEAAIELLEQLPTAATSLNHNNGEYKLSMSDEMVDGWFYDVEAHFVDTNALIAKFYIAGDMSAVYRVDTEAPVLIWGSAQPMLEATRAADIESVFGTTVDENSTNEAVNDILINYVSIIPQNDRIAIGATTPTVITVPGMLPYSLKFASSNPEVAKVDDKGVITGIADGEAVITGTISIDDAAKPFQFTVSSFDNKTSMADAHSTGSSFVLWMIIPVVSVTLLVAFVIIKRRSGNNL